jgi:hypothetical protein
LESYLQHRSQLSNAVASAMPSRISSATASIPLPADLSRLIANAPEVPQPAPAASEEISEEQAIEMEIERRARAMVGMGGANASAAKRPSWLK